jgi:hypothetical protein
MKASKIAREAMPKLFAGEEEFRNKRCGDCAGLCGALWEVSGRNKSSWDISDNLFPSNVAGRENKWVAYKKARKFEGWAETETVYWAKPLSVWGFEAHREESEEAYTARILLLEWYALELEEQGN